MFSVKQELDIIHRIVEIKSPESKQRIQWVRYFPYPWLTRLTPDHWQEGSLTQEKALSTAGCGPQTKQIKIIRGNLETLITAIVINNIQALLLGLNLNVM